MSHRRIKETNNLFVYLMRGLGKLVYLATNGELADKSPSIKGNTKPRIAAQPETKSDWTDIEKENAAKGEAFEQYCRNSVFPKNLYEILEKTHSYEQNKQDYVVSSLNPDYKLRCRNTRKVFYVECKFRSELVKNKLEWATDEQLIRYKANNQKHPVFIAIGLGGKPSNPRQVFIIPVKKIHYTGLYSSVFSGYEIRKDKPIFQNELWKVLR